MRLCLSLFLFVLTLPVYAFDHNHNTYDQLLNRIVVEKGLQTAVDYDDLDAHPEKLDQYLAQLEAVTQNEFNGWNENDQLAFLINAYNAFTLKLIINNYPDIDSIRDLGGLIFKSPWKKKFFTLFGEKTNLDHIEHDLIRENYNEPRIHFAVNCASKGCPALQKQAYIGSQLDQQLEKATIQFLRDPERNRFNKEKKILEISSIFNWFTGDFTKNGSLKNFIAPYISDDPEVQKLLRDNDETGSSGIQQIVDNNSVSIIFLDYDWSLNKR